MRIVCQKCSAAYAIDDKFVTEKGVRAQCPRCRHLQMVKKGEAAAPPLGAAPHAPSGSSPFLFDMPTSPAVPAAQSAPPPSSGGSPFDFNFGAPPPPPPAAAAPPAPAPLSAPATRSPFDFDLSAPPPAPPPAAVPLTSAPRAPAFPSVAPAPLPLPDFPVPPPPAAGPPPFEAPAFDFGVPPPANTADALDALSAPATAKCKSCGKAISDPFDVALGTCDECRSKQQGADASGVDSNPGRSERVDIGAISASLKPPSAAGQIDVIPAPVSANAPAPVAQPSTSVRSAMRDGEGGGRGKMVAGIAAALVLIVGVGGLLFWKRPWVRRPPKVTTAVGPATSKAIDDIVQRWKLNYPELADESSSQAVSHVQKGEEHLARDTTAGYADAEEEFEKSLVLDSSSDRAIAGWVLAVAFGRGSEIDDLTSKAADSMLTAAEQRSGAPALYVSHAHLDIARGGNSNDVQHRAEIGKNAKNPHEKALALLAIGQAQLQKNAQMAEASFKEALGLDPKLKRAYLFQANLAISLGKFREAVDSLEKRLSLDADQWEASETLARLDVELGEPAKAKKVLDDARAAAPKSARPRLALAVYAYQHQGDLNGAAELLTTLTTDGEVTKKDQVDAFLHLAIVRRLQGDLERAKDLIEKALELQPDHVAARVQQVLILTDKGVPSQARLTMDALKGKAPAWIETVLEGRLFFLEGRHADAIASLTALADKDPAQGAAVLLAGAAAAKARKDGKAWELCLKRALRMDPLANPLPAMTPFYIRAADIVRPAGGAWANLASGTDEDPNPFLCEGMVAYFAEDNATAEKHFARVTNIDPRNADGYAMRAFLALRRKDIGSAMTQGAKAVGANKTHGLAHFSMASAAIAANKIDLAKGEATAANKATPGLLGPRVIMGDVEARQKAPAEARRLLTGVLLADPTYREAKKSLFRHSL